ncbi:MAG: hypothetical protein HYV75_03520, partial [Opitutae bacterium]|nr:hypothetical protein [Opitutae bacterium]
MATHPTSVPALARAVFPKLGLSRRVNAGVFDGAWTGSGRLLASHSPIDGSVLAQVRTATPAEYERA